ncbi:hypothetical protein [Sphingomonas lycopersici]|uniref:Terminase n=1 Tax=Sphingomonas lycopersici TaxID=2951807 RepID=A0AA41ZE28_9SPHN|nr:hypothetical protein [Sphingomonas lycopersici]MCW6532287.1 hypothetical protein [Sphingomonas lycopersici]MCW6534911.1 hypothetical protein [Sphingomonas lycopersici]
MDEEGQAAPRRDDPRHWPAAKREAFFDMLSVTCNVTAAATAGGVTARTAYRWRRRDADFAAQWSEALALGYEVLELALVGQALAGDDRDAIDRGGAPPVSVDLALKLLAQHRHAPGKPGRRAARTPGYAVPEDSDRAILAKLAVIEARRAKQAKDI